MSALELAGGGEAWVLEAQVDRVLLAATRAYPPGATLVGSLAGRTVRVKVRGSKRTAARSGEPAADLAPFDVEGRLVDATRADRELVLAHVVARPA